MSWLSLLTLCASLFAAPLLIGAPAAIDTSALATSENDPSSLIEGKVSAVTGDLYLFQEDLVIQGYEPIPICRSYISHGRKPIWTFLPHLIAEDTLQGAYLITEPNGSKFYYHHVRDFKEGKEKYSRWEPRELGRSGYSNTSRGKISARSNVKNSYVILDEKGKYLTLHCSDGTVRSYKKIHHDKEKNQKQRFLLQSEQLSNGNRVLYTFDDRDKLRLIRTTDPSGRVTYATAEFRYLNPKVYDILNCDIVGSDGQVIRYRHSSDGYLSSMTNSSPTPDQQWKYYNLNYAAREGWKPVLSQIAQPLGRLTSFTYYDKKEETIAGIHVAMQDIRGQEYADGSADYQWDARRDRVSRIQAPVGEDARLYDTSRIIYDLKQRKTSAYDVEDCRTDYFWDEEFHLKKIEQFSKEGIFHHAEQFAWGGGNLLCRSFIDQSRRVLFARLYAYDPYGNVAIEKLYGNLSGKGVEIILDNRGLPVENGAECNTKLFSYNAKRLIERQEESNGCVVLYEYYQNTTLPSARFICDRERMQLRHFYQYDSNLILIGEIIDDGCSTDPQHLKAVTARLIKKIQPKKQAPYIGLPEAIEEKYWDGTKEVLLTKTVFHYAKQGALVHRKDIYDVNETLRYSLIYDYDEKSRLKEETNAIGQKASYQFDDLSNRTYQKDCSGRVETYLEYDCSNRLKRSKEVGFDRIENTFMCRYDPRHNLTSETDAHGHETTHAYDPFGHCIKTVLPPIPNEEGNLMTPAIKREYDSAGNEILHLDAKGNATRTSYNAYGKPIAIVHPDGTQEEFTYFLDGSLKTHTDPKGVVTAYAYDFLNRPKEKTIFSTYGTELAKETCFYKGYNLISKTDAEGYTTLYSYDGAGRKIAEVRCGETIAYGYDPLGKQNRVEEEALVSLTEYDEIDRIISEKKQSKSSGETLRFATYRYDSAGNRCSIVRSVEGKESQETLVYDSMNRLTQRTDPLGQVDTYSYDDAFRNPQAQVVLQTTHVDPAGLRTTETYNTLGQVAIVEKRKAQTLFLQDKIYDFNGSPSLQIDTVYSPGATARKIHTRWEYDNRNRLKTFSQAAHTDKARITTYTYHPRGELFQITKPNHVVLTHHYNDLGYLTSLTSSDNTVDHHMEYDRRGFLTRTDNIHRTVDPLGRLLTETYPPGYSLENRYDTRGRRRHFLLPKAKLAIEYEYGPLDMKKVIWNGLSHTYSAHDLSGNLLQSELMGNMGTLQYTYDLLSRKTSISSPSFFQATLAFNPAGSIQKMRIQGEDLSFTYDDLEQLTSETGIFDSTYSSDSLSNRLQKNGEVYNINDLNQITSHSEYDQNGNPKQFADLAFRYDALDRLIEIQAPAFTQSFTYDSLNRCLTKTTTDRKPQETLYFLYDGLNEIGSFNQNLQLQDLRILGRTSHAEIGAAVALLLQGQVYLPVHDLQGNVAALLPLAGGDPVTYRYSAFGEETSTNATPNPWRFSSKRTDASTGLVNFGRRYYLPALGRWLTPDPETYTDGVNLYAFVHNNPLTHLDLYGLRDLCDWVSGDPDYHQQVGLSEYDFPFNSQSRSSYNEEYYAGRELNAMQPYASMPTQELLAYVQGMQRVGSPLFLIDPEIFCQVSSSYLYPPPHLDAGAIVSSYLVEDILGVCGLFKAGISLGRAVSSSGFVKNAVNRMAKTATQQQGSRSGFHGRGTTKVWPAASEGRQLIRGLEYTTHALERMSPRGLIQKGTEIVSRGVPPSVIENAIKFGTKTAGSTPNEIIHIFENVRVVTNLEATRVITVITTGR